MPKPFYKHKLLLDEHLYHRRAYPTLNECFDVKHIKDDLHHDGMIDILIYKASLSPEMALRIEKAFGLSMETLLRMQAWYDAYAMRERADEINVSRYAC